MEKYKSNFDKGTLCNNKLIYNRIVRKPKAFIKEHFLKSVADHAGLRSEDLGASSKKGYHAPTRRCLYYTRYASNFIVGLIGDKTDAEKVKADITGFLNNQLGLELNKIKINH